MKNGIKPDAVLVVSGNVVVRLVKNEMVLFSVATCEDEADNEPHFLNDTGQAIWQKIDGRKKLKDIVKELAAEFKTPVKIIEKDVIGFVEKMVARKLIIEVSKA